MGTASATLYVMAAARVEKVRENENPLRARASRRPAKKYQPETTEIDAINAGSCGYNRE